jgi:DnaK suppressor protein
MIEPDASPVMAGFRADQVDTMVQDKRPKRDARARLERELTSSRNELAGLRAELDALARDESQEGGVPANHMADEGSDVYERERLMTFEAESLARIEMIEDALARLDAGTYGTCQRCSRKIARGRLDALPFAAYCIDCQELIDAGTVDHGVRVREPLKRPVGAA